MYSISCVIPVYNEGKYLYKQIKYCSECLEKNFEEYELILVNDGSKDNTLQVMEKLGRENTNIILMDNYINLNMGVSVQRGFTIASKQYITFNAVDMPLDPKHFYQLIEYMDKNKVDLLVVEREKYLGTSGWRRFTSKINRGLMRILFPKLKKGIEDTNYLQIVRKECIPQIMPLAKSPIFTWPEMIFRAELAGMNVRTKKVEYNPRVIRKGAFGKPHDIIWGIYDMLRFRIRMVRGL